MAEGHKVCCFRVRRRRFCIAAMVAFAVMIMSMIVIVTITESQPSEGFTVVYVLIDFTVVLIFLMIFGFVDHYCCPLEKPVQKKKKKAPSTLGDSSMMTTYDAANSGFADDQPVVFFSSADATSSGDATFSADTSCSVDVSCSADASCSADTSCD